MTAISNYLKALWAQEPVRGTLYTVLVGLVGFLLVKGGLDGNLATFIDPIIAALLGVPVAAELVRLQVKPNNKV
ncbi:hypothetical protein ACFYY5_29620 [Nocardia elegans]|uniref:Holin n=1 Tax=Nocardia elegans TaxID=300029 RepID=A0ABW6TLK4_9NOCA